MGLQLPKRLRMVGLTTVSTAGLLLLGGCSEADQTQLKRLAQPVGATDRTDAMHDLWIGSWIAALIIGVLVWGLIIYASVRYRRRSDDEIPIQTRYNLPIEILYTIAPVVIVLVLFYYTVVTQNEVLEEHEGEPDHTIAVVGQQWSWTFNYMEDDALDGSTTVFEAGTPAYRPTLVLPVDETVLIELTSPDVAHSFWVPAFLTKMDVIPGLTNTMSFTPTREGTYVGRCAELCGTYHSRMLFDLEIVSAEEYADNLAELEEKGNIGPILGGEDAQTQTGLNDEVQDNDIGEDDGGEQ